MRYTGSSTFHTCYFNVISAGIKDQSDKFYFETIILNELKKNPSRFYSTPKDYIFIKYISKNYFIRSIFLTETNLSVLNS